MSDFDTVLERLLLDPQFKAALAGNPEAALAEYQLSSDERLVLLADFAQDTGDLSTVEERTSKASMIGLMTSFSGGLSAVALGGPDTSPGAAVGFNPQPDPPGEPIAVGTGSYLVAPEGSDDSDLYSNSQKPKDYDTPDLDDVVNDDNPYNDVDKDGDGQKDDPTPPTDSPDDDSTDDGNNSDGDGDGDGDGGDPGAQDPPQGDKPATVLSASPPQPDLPGEAAPPDPDKPGATSPPQPDRVFQPPPEGDMPVFRVG